MDFCQMNSHFYVVSDFFQEGGGLYIQGALPHAPPLPPTEMNIEWEPATVLKNTENIEIYVLQLVHQTGWIPVLLCLLCCFVIGHYVIAFLISRALARARNKFPLGWRKPGGPARGQVASSVNGAIGFRLFRKI
jgi:hypothetical protein